jgi:hypothetical protein
LKKAQFNKNDSVDDDDEPQFDCSGGLRLSDSESNSDVEEKAVVKSIQKKKVLETTNNDTEDEGNEDGLIKVHDNLQKMKALGEKLAGTSNNKVSKTSQQKENVNVADILAMGETKSKNKQKSQKKRAVESDSDSDNNWEDVEGKKRMCIGRNNYVDLLKKFEYIEQ